MRSHYGYANDVKITFVYHCIKERSIINYGHFYFYPVITELKAQGARIKRTRTYQSSM